MLTFFELANEQRNVRSFKDHRKKVDRYIVGYKDENGYEYRKSFEFPVKSSFDKIVKPSIPMTIE